MTYLEMAKMVLTRTRESENQIVNSPTDLPAEWHFLWDERAAIMEHDAKMPREQAEAMALDDILGIMRREGYEITN